jgi:hypothetical protein
VRAMLSIFQASSLGQSRRPYARVAGECFSEVWTRWLQVGARAFPARNASRFRMALRVSIVYTPRRVSTNL